VTDDREVWIVGEPEESARADAHAYHHGSCYVLDQIRNRDRKRKIKLALLPHGYAPCEICAPGGRVSGEESETTAAVRFGLSSKPAVRVVKSGDQVEIQDADGESGSTYRVALPGKPLAPDEISARSPLGAALIGREKGARVEFTTPSGKTRVVRIVRFGRAL
jgi:hypothetical protein